MFGMTGKSLMSAGLQAAKKVGSTTAGRHGASMAIGAMGGYAASDEGVMSTTAGMVGGAALGLAASRGAFGSTVGKGAAMLNRQARKGYQGAAMYCNKGMNAIKSTMKG